MKSLFTLIILLSFFSSQAQVVEIFTGRRISERPVFDLDSLDSKQLEMFGDFMTEIAILKNSIDKSQEEAILFGKGLLDYQFNGQLEANIQVLKIRIGEPNGFSIPFYLLTGATSTIFGDSINNKSTVADLISPTGGFVNGFFNGYFHVLGSGQNITKLRTTFSVGGRLLSGNNEQEKKQKIFGAGYFDAGLLFQTGAWEANNNYVDGGVFWVQLKYAATLASKSNMESIFGVNSENPSGLRLELGILIQDKVNVKLGGYIPQTGKDLPTLDNTAWKLAFDYKVSK